jgi:hypothetical protein
MNERIKVLVGQAKFMAEETINRKISKNAELDAFAEKFAELIVKECITVMYDSAIKRKVLPDLNQTPTYYALAVLEHFGVEYDY